MRYISRHLLFLLALVVWAQSVHAQSISPSDVTLKPSQTQLFSVLGGGKAYTWAIYPSTGTITSAGLYTAPSSIPLESSVTIYAESTSLPTLTTTVTLMPNVSISVLPAAISLTNGQSAPFSVTVTGTTNTAYTWSTPAYGTLDSSGNYTVPTTLNSPQTVYLTATSVEDPTKSASSTVTLLPTISVTLNPTLTSLGGGQTTALNGVVYGTTNTGINWSMSPQIGTLANGFYTAPSPIPSTETVTITATSQAASSRSASVTLTLVPVSISLTPASASLKAGQSLTLTATVSGSSDTAVNWTVSPAVGSVSNGVYTAPSSVSTAETVTITATSAADPSKSASATVSVAPSVSVSVTPSTASLEGGQSTTFKATVSGSSNTSVNWSMSPSAGTLSNGVYTAPATIASAEKVTVTATSAANTAESASATVSLVPVSVSVTPSSASLSGGQSATLKATVSGSSNTNVNWSLSPSVGTIANGVYTAPATIASAQTITVKASSAADSTKSASATISLVPVSISISPTTASLTGGQSTSFSASLSGTSNAGVNWSMSPSVGTLSNGSYTAPATISSAQTVTVTATSAADSTKSASATISLVPVSVTITPASVSLAGGQTQQFNVSLSGTSNPNVTWTLSPAAGSLSNGSYQAPSTITTQQTVTVTAVSAADSTKSASATVTLLPPAAVTLTPSSVSLTGGQSAQFSVTIGGTASTAVTWTLAPSVGTISNGLYTAPTSITSQQTVTLTVASTANSSQTAQATITLNPSTPATPSVSPTSAALSASQTQQFSATNLGTNPAWTISPQTGTVSASGLYTAPSSITAQTVVTVTATNASNSAQSASATVTLNPPSGQSGSGGTTPTTITLPIEVMGAAGTTIPVSFNIPSGASLSGQLQLWLQIHGLKYQTEASVQVNGGTWIPINDSTVTLQGLAPSYGGIGGGFSTLKLTMNLPSGSIVSGTNTLTFQFIGTDGVTSGYRVLNLNILAANGSQLIPSTSFTQDDPSTWQPPLNDAADIAAGQSLYTGASLTTPGGAIHATCSMCHAVDGRDLKYFNYSNFSIQTRAMFHGLTAQQGNQIASYIRSLNIIAPATARPWNPPYQPGPGTDSNPVSEWAAGAGIDAVLDEDSDMMSYLMPGGSTAGWAPTANLSARNIPVAVQFLDWNRWLPTIHPIDSFGSTFTSSELFTNYQAIRAGLTPGSASTYANEAPVLWVMSTYMYNFDQANQPTSWNSLNEHQFYSVGQWLMVKLWEINQEFGLEGMPQVAFGSQADSRAWFSQAPFKTVNVPLKGFLLNGQSITETYLTYVWYHLQLILNSGNGQFVENSPIDFSYVYDHVSADLEISNDVPGSVSNGPLMLMWLIKALQESNYLPGPDQGDRGWAPNANRAEQVFNYGYLSWQSVPMANAGAAIQAYLTYWLAKVQTFTPQQFYTGGWTTATDVPNPAGTASNSMANYVYFMIPEAKYYGVSQTLLQNLVSWAQTMWPNYTWSNLLQATCTQYQNYYLNCPVP